MMTEQEIAAIAVKLADMLSNSPHLCLHAEDWGKIKGQYENLSSSQALMCKKFDLLSDAVYKMRGERNTRVALIGATGVIVGTSIPFVLPVLIRFFANVV
jgi:hypothetical protein